MQNIDVRSPDWPEVTASNESFLLSCPLFVPALHIELGCNKF